MANIKSAKKRVKVTAKKTAQNRVIKDDLKAAYKAFDAAIVAKDMDDAAEKRTALEKQLKKAATKHVISKQSANRHVSQITKKLNAAKAGK